MPEYKLIEFNYNGNDMILELIDDDIENSGTVLKLLINKHMAIYLPLKDLYNGDFKVGNKEGSNFQK